MSKRVPGQGLKSHAFMRGIGTPCKNTVQDTPGEYRHNVVHSGKGIGTPCAGRMVHDVSDEYRHGCLVVLEFGWGCFVCVTNWLDIPDKPPEL